MKNSCVFTRLSSSYSRMASLQVLVLSMLAVLFCAPFTYAADTSEIMSYYPPFPKCIKEVTERIEAINKIFPPQDVYSALTGQDRWTMLRSSYSYKMSDAKKVTLQAKGDWFNVTVEKASSSYTLNYVVNRTEGGGIQGHTLPVVPQRSWVLYSIMSGSIVQAHYVCNGEYESEETPLHGDIWVADSALKNTDMFSSLKNVEFISKLMEPFTKFTFFPSIV